MKRDLFLAGLVLIAISCEKNPDMDQTDTRMTVYTDYDSEADFNKYKTYYLPDSLLDVGSQRASYWSDENARKLVKEVEYEMNGRGYVRVKDPALKSSADLGIQLSYVSETNRIVSGGYYGGWWDYWYWGPMWGGLYYPYPVSYSYSTNTLVMEMLDLTDKTPDTRIPVIWRAQASGYQYSPMYNIPLLQEAIVQAFGQSEYLGCKNS